MKIPQTGFKLDTSLNYQELYHVVFDGERYQTLKGLEAKRILDTVADSIYGHNGGFYSKDACDLVKESLNHGILGLPYERKEEIEKKILREQIKIDHALLSWENYRNQNRYPVIRIYDANGGYKDIKFTNIHEYVKFYINN